MGQNAGSLESSPALDPVTKVILLVDEENYYEAGTGDNVMEVSCPYGSQQMANDILASLQGYSYQPATAGDALLDPAAEFGDAMTVDGLYTVIANMDITFDQLMTSDVGAPGEQEIESEYPYQSQQTTETNRKLAQTRSLITKTAEAITLRVDGLEDDYTEVSTTLDGLTVTDPSGQTIIDGSKIQTSNLYVDAANISGTLTANQINLTGAITWADLATDAKSQVTSAQNIANNAQDTANSALLQANGAMNVSGETASKVTGWTYTGTTYIDGNKLMTGTVTATTLQGGTVQLIDQNKFVRGEIYIRSASSTSGAAIEFESAGPMALTATSGSLYLDATTIQMACSTARPNGSNQSDLGTTGIRWKDLYLTNSPNVTSDENSKHDIELLPEKYVKLFDRISPYRYKLDAGTSGRYHTGFIAQDVKSGMDFSDITPQEFSAWIEDTDENGDVIYALRYEELIAIAWAKIKELESRIEELEAEL